MLTIKIPDKDFWNEETQRFVTIKGATVELEHSLVSLSKWEARFEKAFLGPEKKTNEETLAYVECMCLNDVDPDVFKALSSENIEDINVYIAKKMTATTFHEPPGGTSRGSRELITAEIIYYWMTTQQIPIEAETWHLSRLITLIRVISLKNAPKKKMPRREQMAQQRALNAQRQAQYGG